MTLDSLPLSLRSKAISEQQLITGVLPIHGQRALGATLWSKHNNLRELTKVIPATGSIKASGDKFNMAVLP
jgi:hypothetical protein